MAKKIFSIEVEAVQATRNKNGSQINFGKQLQKVDNGIAAREAVMFNVVDPKLSAAIEPGKKYTVTITEE